MMESLYNERIAAIASEGKSSKSNSNKTTTTSGSAAKCETMYGNAAKINSAADVAASSNSGSGSASSSSGGGSNNNTTSNRRAKETTTTTTSSSSGHKHRKTKKAITNLNPNSNSNTSSNIESLWTALQEEAIEFTHDDEIPLSFAAKRHQESIEPLIYERHPWRIRERMKTASVALVLCLNIGVDPPDVVKIQPCSRLECWIDPSSVSVPKAMELIGSNLQMQYERWQPRARYKKCNDPTVEDVKKLCTSLRRNAKGERILFHYNGHGVPKPTANGEIWVFNRTFTQYIPLSIFELINWMAAPSIYVYDCSNAGIIINSFQPFAEQHEQELEKALQAQLIQSQSQTHSQSSAAQSSSASQLVSYKNCIHLAACAANEILPMNAQLPADLFTSCLTTPINIALKWYAMQEKLGMVPRIQSELIDKIPGKVNDRRTMMGELNWIFTAITDTIAWNTLPRELFQRLFRQDLLVASLFRNFLLAERILRSHDCTPVSLPALPPCHRHAMWKAWDLVVDLALQQLPDILEQQAPYRQLPFFEHQLTAFQVWLDSESESRTPPEQLPIVLQVLLSQVHRLRALELLARFLDLGPWAVNLALGVGIFPYVLKLLQSSTRELRPVLVFIWAKILAVDPSCQVDLVKEYKYFLSVLQDNTVSKQHRTLSAFVLASIVHNFLLGQTSALQGPLLSICLEQLNDSSWLLRQWLAICLGMLWQNFEKARWSGARDLAHEKLYVLLRDPIPEVRAAAVFALGTFISSVTDRSEEQANNIDRIIAITLLETVGEDMSPLVRLELAAALQWMVLLFETQFVTVYLAEQMNSHSSALVSCGGERSASITHGMPHAPSASYAQSTHSLERFVPHIRRGVSSSSISNMSSSGMGTGMGSGSGSTTTTNFIPFQSIFTKLWLGIYNLGQDPFPAVAATAQRIISHVRDAALCMITAKEATNATTAGSSSSGSGTGSGSGSAAPRDLEKLNNSSLSVSLPPSPNTRCNYLGGSGESPPVGHHGHHGHHAGHGSQWVQKLRLSGGANAETQRKLRTSSMNDETDGGAGGATAHPSAGISGTGGSAAGLTAGDGNHSARSSGSETNPYADGKAQMLQPIVQTQFIPWAISYFTRPGNQRYSSAEGGSEEEEGKQRYPIDRNSSELRSRKYRYQRNEFMRQWVSHRRISSLISRLNDANSWARKTQFTPSLVKLLPYEPQIAVAYKEKVLVYDFVKNSVLSYATEANAETSLGSSLIGATGAGGGGATGAGGSGSGSVRKTSRLEYSSFGGASGSPFARVSSFELLNAQDVGLMLVAHDDGVIRVWQSTSDDDSQPLTTRLISAWDALPRSGGGGGVTTGGVSSNLPTNSGSSSSSSSVAAGAGATGAAGVSNSSQLGSGSSLHYGNGSGMGIVTAWQQSSQHLVVGGGSYRYLRIWDVERELKLNDFQLGRDTSVRVLSPFMANRRCDTIVAGCSDGSVRLFDKRCAPHIIRVIREHAAPILHACLRADDRSLVVGCNAGKVCVFDLRGWSHWDGLTAAPHEWQAGGDITAMATHPIADAVACGNASKISIYSLKGKSLSSLRSNEGFMGSRNPHPTCLSFHSFNVQLAVGFVDNTVAVYSPTPVL
ncbi:regulatory-associated protein of mTOR-like isoform X1 [Drosophila innubila]|uniref:regulatory-associated protein of mTOR-like isoform X1 n=1 Tax=Drosophila innubila TaxID=198719 RepID=UPI00148D3E7D|nr:regulatory-associated protein of mTOR-like isoform X1 [Drosophila innubila]